MPLVSDPSFRTGTQLVLDPSEVAVDRTEFPMNEGDVKVAEGGPDWNQSAIVAAMAEAARGELPVDFRIPNRQITIPLLLGGTPGGADFDTQRRYLQAKVGLIQREGGWLKRQDPGKDPIYFDLVNASLTLPDQYGHLNVESGVVLTLEAIPDFYGDEDELTLSVSSETTLPELTFTVDGIEGDYPGRLRLEVTNDSAADQLGLVACVRSRHYDPADTARLAYEAEALTPLDTAAVDTLAGASGGSAVKHLNLSEHWTPVLSTNLADGTFLTHKGSYRVRARVWSTYGAPPALRLVWDVGDLVFPEENDPWLIPEARRFYIADLGEIRLDPVTAGDHRWQGQIQGKAVVNGVNVWIDRVWLEPLDEGHAVLRASPPAPLGSAGPVAIDSFDQSAGALDTQVAFIGGAWSTSGDADDFLVDDIEHVVVRNAHSDSGPGPYPGRFAISGAAALAAQAVQIDFGRLGTTDGILRAGVVARWVDASNYLIATVDVQRGFFEASVVVAGAATQIASGSLFDSLAPTETPAYTWRMAVGPSGAMAIWFGPRGSDPKLIATGADTALATGGALASGKPGFYDQSDASVFLIRMYDNFLASGAVFDAVAFAGQSVQLATDGNVREDSTGTAYGPVSIDSGDLLRIPPSGIEGRTVEFMVKPSRGDFDALPDSAIDDLSVQAWYRASYLTMPW
jgi:hypothetical protein